MKKVTKANNLSVQQMRSFCTVFERKSYATAAREMEIAVPTLWEQVRAVEKQYGTVFFQRRGRRIEPTPSAEVLYESMHPLLAGLDSTFEQLRELHGEGPNTVTLAAGVRMMCEDLGPALRQFRDGHPQVALRLLHGDDELAVRMVAEGTADLALTLEPGPDFAPGSVSCERAYAIDYLAAFPAKHPLKKTEVPQLSDVVRHPLVLGHPGTSGRALFEQALHRENLLDQLRVAAETDNSAVTIACVRAGLGVGILAGQATASPLTYNLETRSLSHALGQAHVVFRRKKGRRPTTAIRDLMDLVVTELS